MKTNYNPYEKHTTRLAKKQAALNEVARQFREKQKTPAPPEIKPALDVDNLPLQVEPVKSGFFTSEKNEDAFQQFKNAENRKYQSSLLEFERARAAQTERSENNRLVNIRKSPTKDKAVNDRQCMARIYHREWSGGYRISVDSFSRLQAPPPAQAGDRVTSRLTDAAAKKITDAGAYAVAVKGGFCTFGTLTFDAESRDKILKFVCHFVEQKQTGDYCNGIKASGAFSAIEFRPSETIGQNVSRFMDALQKKITRGWTWKPSAEERQRQLDLAAPVRFEGRDKKLNYIWVAENPENNNPHVHYLIDWGVEREHFLGWAAQLEKLWSKGFNNLQKIKDSNAATGYLLKALGYMSKGAQSIDETTGAVVNSQGDIIGNRYGISSEARAPAWECIAEYDAHIMGQVIVQIGGQIEAAAQRVKEQLSQARANQRHDAAQLAKLNNYKNIPQSIRQQKAQRITRRLQREKQLEKSLKHWREKNAFGGKYSITFRAKAQLDKFIEYAVIKRGWVPVVAKHAQALEHITNESRQIASWAQTKGQEIYKMVAAKKYDFQNYINQILFDGVPPEPVDMFGLTAADRQVLTHER